ncbi:inositol monophosphatase family protein [Halobellus ruber]|uniref:fructose-bisphosphatase n=1 Tax=Halobellus ruber TaxID=2761102 RepID=A0A7J9SF44_9EURY|nr:inositol monophosphatase family protein [Halobellus ruber]MBB6645338.1 inositol monophosphatase [Halobellus ruber]
MTDETASRARLTAVAERAVRAGGGYLADAFRDGSIDADYGTDDVKAAADRAAEERVLDVIGEAYPAHAVRAEESGQAGDHRYEWVVDPLDGTNNFAAGVPSFATAACVLHEGTPVVSAVYEPLPDDLYLARRDGGATVDGAPVAADSDVSLSAGTVSFVVGLPALRDADRRAVADRVESSIGAECKRVLDTWSPCVDWGLLARGGIEGLVAYYPDVYEQYAGELLAKEAGARTRVLDPENGEAVSPDADETGPTGVGTLYVAATTRTALDRLADAAAAPLPESEHTG